MSWFKVPAQARITKAIFDFENNLWEVTEYIDFLGPNSNKSILSKEFRHSFYSYDEDFQLLERILESRCGEDMVKKEQVWEALSKNQKMIDAD